MRLRLTDQEQKDLIFQQGDFFEVISGSLTFSSRRQYRETQYADPLTEMGFFFESTDQSWGTQEWRITMQADVPNGPALLVLYRRNNTAEAFGIVSMINRAWANAQPLRSIGLIDKSDKFSAHRRAQVTGILQGVVTAATPLGIVTAGPALLAGALGTIKGVKDKGLKEGLSDGRKETKRLVNNVTGWGRVQRVNDEVYQSDATARSLMFRLVKTADQYWEGGSGSSSGRL